MPVSKEHSCLSPRPGTEATSIRDDSIKEDTSTNDNKDMSQNSSDEAKAKPAGAVAVPISEHCYEDIFDAVMERVQRADEDQGSSSRSQQDDGDHKDKDGKDDENGDDEAEEETSDNEDEDQDDKNDEEPEDDEDAAEEEQDEGHGDEMMAEFRDLQTPTFDDADDFECNKTPPKLSQRKPKMVKKKRGNNDNGKQPNQRKKRLGKTKSTTTAKEPSKKKKRLQQRDIEETGVWVQCMNRPCMKWRYLTDITDPSKVPDFWKCELNTDPLYNNCEAPEQDYQSLDFVFNKFTEGSIVWAKMGGYPWVFLD
ncbi:uncharacterized protein [Amphiura filiformis]|uniref:uncharacterized protein isoform X2 n=1 Tax=Amphiura filiformis TaxID=82378 RepID=UPI003B216CBA